MNKKGFSLTVVLTILIIVLCFSQHSFGESCPCKIDTAEFMIPVDEDTFRVGMVFYPMSSSDKLSKSSSTMGTFSFFDLWRIDKGSNLHKMTNGFAYRDDLAFYAITDIIGTVDGDSWTTDLVMPDGRIIHWSTITYYKNYGDKKNCYVCDSWTTCDPPGAAWIIYLKIYWPVPNYCFPIGIYTFRFYQNGSIVGSSSFEMKEIQFDHFKVSIVPDTIAYSETAQICVRACDANDNIVPLCAITFIDFSLDENGELYGNLIGPSGAKGKSLTDIPWYLAATGLVRYVADGGEPNGPKTVGVIVNNNYGVTGSGSVVVRKKEKIEPFCQDDSRWAETKYDNYVKNTDAQGNKTYYTVGSKGCALTCMAMIAKSGGADIDPGKLAEYMNDNNGFDEERVKWNAINAFSGDNGFMFDSYSGEGLKYKEDKKTVDLDNSKTISLSLMEQSLSDGALIIAQVYNPTTKNNHWVLVTDKKGSDYSILDPGCYSGRTTLSNGYGNNVYKFISYKRN